MDTKKVEACMVSTFLLYICSRFSTEVCEDDSRVFVLFVCDAFLSGVIGMHLFLYITTNTILVVTNIRRHSFEICGCEFLVKHQLFQVSYFPLLLPVLCNDLGLIIADVRMMHHSLYTCLIDVDPVNLSSIHGEPRTELLRF